jgi:asparagine synthase (glutamine-hydrolysing)
LNSPPVKNNISIIDIIDELEALLLTATRLQSTADVDTAILLSGGTDSSLITALAARSYNKVKTFTVGFDIEGKHDERKFSRIIANHFCTDHTEIIVDQGHFKGIWDLVLSMGEPLCDSSLIPTYFVSREVSKHVKVALGGDGGDELFGGYQKYNLLNAQNITRNIVRPTGLLPMLGLLGTSLPIGFSGKPYLSGFGVSKAEGIASAITLFDKHARQRLVPCYLDDIVDYPEKIKGQYADHHYITDSATRMDFQTYLPEDILVKVDRASMACSLEVRAPFLDHRVVEFAFNTIHSSQKVGIFTRKMPLRHLAKRILPSNFNSTRKQGFSIPLKHWIDKSGKSILADQLKLLPPDIFSEKYITGLYDSIERGYDVSEKLFCLAVLGVWISGSKARF